MDPDINRVIYIIGASGHGKVIAELAELLGYTVYFYDDTYPETQQIEHWTVLGTFNDLLQLELDKINVAVAIGNNVIRQEKMLVCEKHHYQLPLLIHPKAILSQYAQVDKGTVVLAGAVINAFARVGRGCIINTASVVEHDCVISDFVHISPNSALAGSVFIGECSWVGIGSQVNQLVNIGEHVLIGAGSTVVKNIPANVVAFGSPAKVISHNR